MSPVLALVLKNWKYFKCRPDLIVLSKSCEYKVHRIVFLCLSPYFQKIFQYRSESSDGYYRLDLRDVSDDILVSIINFAYQTKIDINDHNIEQLVITADKYNIISIMKRCEQFLSQGLNEDNCMETYLLSHYYNCHQLMSITEKYIIDNNVLTKQIGDTNQGLTFDMIFNEWQKQNKE